MIFQLFIISFDIQSFLEYNEEKGRCSVEKVFDRERYLRFDKLFLKVAWLMIVFSILLLLLSAALVRAIIATPEFVIAITSVYLYYHFAYFGYGLFRIFRFTFVIRKKKEELTVWRSVLGILLAPVSFIILYTAIFLFALSSCAA